MKHKLTVQQQILEDFARTFEEETGEKYFINWGRETKSANALIEMNISPDEYVARKKAYFADTRWKEYGGWGFSTFVNNINKLVPFRKTKTSVHQKRDAPRRKMEILCAECKRPHDSEALCPTCYPEITGNQASAMQVIEDLTKKMRGQ